VAVPPPAATPAAAPATTLIAPPAAQEPAPEPKVPAKPEPAVKAVVSTSLSARLKALDQGDLDLAVRQGQRLAREIPPSHWTLRLEIACEGDTIRRLVEIFKGKAPDIFLLPIAMRDGRVCYQVLYGRFPNQLAAEKQLKRLPASFLGERNRPKAFRFYDLPKKQ
jgi:septal ring-binding cell division protein DamX